MVPQLIEFVRDWFAEVEVAHGRLRQVAFRRGQTALAVVTPAAARAGQAAADLRLADGTTARQVPLSQFRAREDRARAA